MTTTTEATRACACGQEFTLSHNERSRCPDCARAHRRELYRAKHPGCRHVRDAMLPSAPFVRWLKEREALHDGTRKDLAAGLGIDYSGMCSLLNGNRPSVLLETVDVALCRAGEHLLSIPEYAAILYPDVELGRGIPS